MPMQEKTPFRLTMSRASRILGWCYLPVHLFLLPLMLGVYAAVSANGLSDRMINILYYAIGAVYVLLFFRGYLRADFDTLLDRKLSNFLSLLSGYFFDILLSYAALAVLELVIGSADANPNQEAIDSLAQTDYGTMVGLTVFLAPLVEETLFRGVVFGTLREKNRFLAYAVSILLFSLYHVWQYALAFQDASLLIYMIQYVPVSFVLAWLYDRSGSIWLPIIFHMAINAMAISVI